MSKAKWIWFDYGHDLVNSWMQARRVFQLKRVPSRACARVTADAQYKLWVNGEYVCRGPARGFQSSWPVDTVNLAPYLRKGKNVIAALVHNPGVSTFQYIHEGQAGLFFDCELPGENLASGPEWRVRRAPAFLRPLTRLSLQLGPQEHFDARPDEPGWLLPAYDDRAWKKPACRNKGCMPWDGFEERGIPMLREENLPFVSILSRASGKSGAGYESSRDLVTVFGKEKKTWARADLRVLRTRQALSFTVPKSGKDRYTALCLDFGHETAGAVRLEISGARGVEIVDALVTESVTGLVPDFVDITDGCYVAMGGRLFPRRGATSHEFFQYWGFRFLVLIVRNNVSPLRISASVNTVAYPLNVTGSFSSSDQTLNAVHAVSVRTQRLCMFDAYVDCPWREQAQWWGDARVQARNTFYLSADARLFRRGIRQIGTQQLDNGLTYGHAPTYGHNCVLPDFTLTWIATHWDYYWQTGDLSLFREMRGQVLKALGYFERATAQNGLIGYDDRYWLFLDWAELFKEGYPALYNFYYVMALQAASALFLLTGEKKMAAVLKKREQALRRAILKHLYDPRKKEFLAGLDWKGRPVRGERAHAYALAVLVDLVKKDNDYFVREKLLPLTRLPFAPASGKGLSGSSFPSPFFINYVFQALKKGGENEAVVDCIRKFWGKWVREGFTAAPEVWYESRGGTSLCHAWSAHPIVHLADVLLGVRQLSAGWKEVEIAPCFCGVRSVRGLVATPLGVIKVFRQTMGRKAEFTLAVPQGMKALVRLPGQAPREVTGTMNAVFAVKP